MSKEIVRYKQKRLSRKRLRAWLAEQGPQPVAKILRWAVTQAPSMTSAELKELLASHPTFFKKGARGVWSSVEESPKAVYIRPRRKPPIRTKTRQPGATSARGPARRSPKPFRQPPSTEELQFERDQLVRIVVRDDVPVDAQPYESGGHFLIPLPQREKRSPKELEKLRDALQRVTAPVEFYDTPLGGIPLFRGTRKILQVRLVPEEGHVHLILGPAKNDEGRLVARALNGKRATLKLLPPGPAGTQATAIVEAMTVDEAPLTPELAKAAKQRSPTAKFDRTAAANEVNVWLQKLHLDADRWEEFRDWFISKKVEYDQELIQAVLARAINILVDRPDTVFRLAQLVLDDTVPQPGFAAQFVKALARQKHDPHAAEWALELLPTALDAFPFDSELRLAAARLSYAREELPKAIGLYAQSTADFEPDDWSDYLYATTMWGNTSSQRVSLSAFREQVERCETPDDLGRFLDALGYARDTALALTTDSGWWIWKQLRLHVALDQDEHAVKLLGVVSHEKSIGWEEQLEFASLLEELSDAHAISSGLTLLGELANRHWGRMSIPVRLQVVEQVRILEGLVESPGASIANALLDRVGHHLGVTPAPQGPPPLNGLVITIVGGRAPVRVRLEARLRTQGAADVRHVPPSFEEQFSEAILKAAVSGSHFVLEMTDCVKHDALVAIRNLQGRGYGFAHVPTQGGPSRAMRDLLARVKPKDSATWH